MVTFKGLLMHLDITILKSTATLASTLQALWSNAALDIYRIKCNECKFLKHLFQCFQFLQFAQDLRRQADDFWDNVVVLVEKRFQ